MGVAGDEGGGWRPEDAFRSEAEKGTLSPLNPREGSTDQGERFEREGGVAVLAYVAGHLTDVRLVWEDEEARTLPRLAVARGGSTNMTGDSHPQVSYIADTDGTCPHCGRALRFRKPESGAAEAFFTIESSGSSGYVTVSVCPSCRESIIAFHYSAELETRGGFPAITERHMLLFPRHRSDRSAPGEVPEGVAEDYNEAVAVLDDSPKASAALSRRCLQALLREKGGTKSKDLSGQIDEVLGKLPRPIAEEVDAVRHIGNFSAHATKSQSTGEIVAVEPGEAEWTLEVLDALFDWYYVQPQKQEARREALNAKLADAGKPPMKKPSGEA